MFGFVITLLRERIFKSNQEKKQNIFSFPTIAHDFTITFHTKEAVKDKGNKNIAYNLLSRLVIASIIDLLMINYTTVSEPSAARY